MGTENEKVSIRQIRKIEKKKEKKVYKEREDELFLNLGCLIRSIDELIDVLIEDEGAYHNTSEYVELDTFGLVGVTTNNLDRVKTLTKTIFNTMVETNQVKNWMGLEIYDYTNVLVSPTVLSIKIGKTKYAVTHLKRNDKPFDTNIYTMRVGVKKHKHDFKHMAVEVKNDQVRIILK